MKIPFFNSKELTQDDILNQGLKYVMQFGSTFGQPIQGRLSKKYGTLSQSQLDYYETTCRLTRNRSCYYIYKKLEILHQNNGVISFNQLEIDFKNFIQSEYPWISKANFKKLLNQAWYFAMHDGLHTVIKG